MKKTYILDANVLLSDPLAINAFDDNDIIVPLAVIEELDKQKTRQDEVGSVARQLNRTFDKLREQGSLLLGVQTPGGGMLYVKSVTKDKLCNLPLELRDQKVDNLIIALAQELKESCVLVSKDINVRIKCDALGIKCEDYKHLQITPNEQSFYSGVLLLQTSKELIDDIYNGLNVCPLPEWGKIYPNQILILKQYGQQSGSCIVKVIKTANDQFQLCLLEKLDVCYGLKPRNKEQQFSLSLLYDQNIKLVTLTGIAGSGKSLLALAAGLDQNTHMGSKKTYEKLVIARSTQPVGKDIGFLPGTLNEKLAPWQGASCDNLAFLLKGNGKKQKEFKPRQTSEGLMDPYLSLLLENGIIEIASIAHIRGRSIPNSYIIIEEAQNLSHHEIRTIMTRIGEGSKIVLCGDTDQIDNMLLDRYSNGLTHVIEKFKESTLAAHVTLLKGERSALATEAAKLL